MKIMQFIDSMYTGGAETSVSNCAVEMKRQGLDVSVLCFSIRRRTANELRLEEAGVSAGYIAEECLKKVNLTRCRKRLIRFVIQIFFSVPVFRKIMKQERPDVLHMHLDALLFYPFIPRIIKQRIGAFWTVHSEPDVFLRSGFLARIRKTIIRHNPNIFILVLSEKDLKQFESYGLANHVAVVRNGIDLERFRAKDGIRLRKRSELNISEDAFVVGHIGRFGEGETVKNQRFLVELFSGLLDEHPNTHLVLIGGGKPSESLAKAVSEEDFGERITILTDRSDIPDLLGMMDVFVLPSVYEGFPMTLVEAEAAGLRCVVSDTITKETALKDDICFLPLDAGKEEWIKAILYGGVPETDHGNLEDYGISYVVRKLIDMYGSTIKITNN